MLFTIIFYSILGASIARLCCVYSDLRNFSAEIFLGLKNYVQFVNKILIFQEMYKNAALKICRKKTDLGGRKPFFREKSDFVSNSVKSIGCGICSHNFHIIRSF